LKRFATAIPYLRLTQPSDLVVERQRQLMNQIVVE
jgi:hypothetical protein